VEGKVSSKGTQVFLGSGWEWIMLVTEEEEREKAFRPSPNRDERDINHLLLQQRFSGPLSFLQVLLSLESSSISLSIKTTTNLRTILKILSFLPIRKRKRKRKKELKMTKFFWNAKDSWKNIWRRILLCPKETFQDSSDASCQNPQSTNKPNH
jgi:hypothetical protein